MTIPGHIHCMYLDISISIYMNFIHCRHLLCKTVLNFC
ncbi:hypothetical protein DCAR_0831326 [Daucus carota subsp. sativus]|uniref:Uncharacterized protein n=1 Tax=Daucus carota subsp. sativus TaxID=79200 RepID=A0AAF0XPE1_DAUCS|nr:hypothetical protein DCAR_0831326 [Daucus carota subsp. sativus]